MWVRTLARTTVRVPSSKVLCHKLLLSIHPGVNGLHWSWRKAPECMTCNRSCTLSLEQRRLILGLMACAGVIMTSNVVIPHVQTPHKWIGKYNPFVFHWKKKKKQSIKLQKLWLVFPSLSVEMTVCHFSVNVTWVIRIFFNSSLFLLLQRWKYVQWLVSYDLIT